MPLDENGKIYTNTIKTCGENLLAIINDILDFTKTEHGQIQLENVDFDLHKCVEEVMNIFTAKATEKGIALTCHTENNVPGHVNADKQHLQQILIILIGNAVKFTPAGKVLVKLNRVNKNDDPAAVIQFEIHDTGIGIPEHLLKNLFKAFSQCDASSTRKFGGTGLGLAIADNLVRAMDGKMRVQSTPDEGSCFTFTITATNAAAMALGAPKNSSTGIPAKSDFSKKFPMSILVAEDNDVNAMMILRMLSNLGYQAKLAKNGKEALSAAITGGYNIILMDIQMPEMDGLEATQEIRKIASPQPKIIAVTANALASDQEDCMNAGMNDFMTKPISMNRLQEVLQRWAP
jgi:CheY-like chemotaxis protein